MNNDKKNIFPLISIVIISLSSLIIFFVMDQKLDVGSFGNLLIGGLIGAIITTYITKFLLDKQSEIELKVDKTAKIFEEKLKLYNDFINELHPCRQNLLIGFQRHGFRSKVQGVPSLCGNKDDGTI